MRLQLCGVCFTQFPNQVFHYTHRIRPKRVTEFAVPISASLRPGNTALIRRNVAAVANRWQHRVRFEPQNPISSQFSCITKLSQKSSIRCDCHPCLKITSSSTLLHHSSLFFCFVHGSGFAISSV